MNKQFRNRSYERVTLRVFNVTAQGDATNADSGHTAFSDLDTLLVEAAAPVSTYATLEPDRFVLDGTQLPVPSSAYTDYGYCSSAISDENGDFSAPPTITITFGAEYDLAGISFEFDSVTGDYPTDIDINWYHSGDVLIATETIQPDSVSFMLSKKVSDCAKIVVAINSTSDPYRRARIRKVLLGIKQSFDNTRLQNSTVTQDVDPLARWLPTESMKVNILDPDMLYDPDNPNGYWEYVDILAPIGISKGYTLDDGTVEWLPEIMHVLDGKPSVSGMYVSFDGHRTLYNLTGTYNKGAFPATTVSLYDLAEDVLIDALGANGSWSIDTALQSIYTSAPLPVKTHRECLQLIAHAGMATLYTDHNGIITIKSGYMPDETTDIAYNGMNSAWSTATVDKISPLYAVDVLQYQYVPAASATTVYSGAATINGTETIHVDFSMAKDLSASVTGGTLNSSALYAAGADLNITASGTVTITVTGKSVNTVTLSNPFITGLNSTGETETADNPLVTSTAHQKQLAQYRAEYLALRSTYTLSVRGNPEIEVGDIVTFAVGTESSGAEQAAIGLVLKTKTDFKSALSGEVILKRLTNNRNNMAYANEFYSGETIMGVL